MKKQNLLNIIVLVISILTTETSSKNTQVRKSSKNQIQVEIQSIKKNSNSNTNVKRINSGSSSSSGGSVVVNHGNKNSDDFIVVIETDGNTNSNNENDEYYDSDDDDDDDDDNGSGNIFHKVTIGLGPNSGISITHSSGSNRNNNNDGIVIDTSSLSSQGNKNKRESTATIKKIKSNNNDRSSTSTNSIVLDNIEPHIVSTNSNNNNNINIKTTIKASSSSSNNNEDRIILDNLIDKSGIINENDILVSDKMDKIFQSILKNLDADLAQMKNTAIQKKFLSLPCVDIDPIVICQPRVNNGDCYSIDTKVKKYMMTYCKNSCDLCNTLLTLPTGIPQRIHYKENKQDNKDILVAKKLEPTVCIKRLQHVESSMNKYVETLHSYVNNTITNKEYLLKIQPCFNKYDQCIEWSILGFCELYPKLMKSTCGPACHMCHEPIQIIENYYNADQSYNHHDDDDDDDDDDMLNNKKKNTKNKNKKNNKLKNTKSDNKYDIMSLYNPFSYSISTPFLRGDMYGIFEAIEKNRIIKGWNDIHGTTTTPSSASASASTSSSTTSSSSTTNNNKKSYHERFVSIDIYTPRIFKPEKQDVSDYDNKNKISQGNSEPTIIQLNDFLTKEECNYLLALVKEQEKNKMEKKRNRKNNKKDDKNDDDGFGSASTDARVNPANNTAKAIVARFSHRIFLFPARLFPLYLNKYNNATNIDNNNKNKKSYNKQKEQQQPPLPKLPMFEDIMSKFELITGIPSSHLEIPIQFDKFKIKHFQDNHAHFIHRSSLDIPTQQYHSLNTLVSEEKANKDLKGNAFVTPTQFGLHNPRVLGMIIFLSDVEEGGDLIFKNLGQSRIQPKMGRAVLFQTVYNLKDKGNNDYDDDDGYVDYEAQYYNSTYNINNKTKSRSGLREDNRTHFIHSPVTSGTKYTVTFYFRQRGN